MMYLSENWLYQKKSQLKKSYCGNSQEVLFDVEVEYSDEEKMTDLPHNLPLTRPMFQAIEYVEGIYAFLEIQLPWIVMIIFVSVVYIKQLSMDEARVKI